MNFPPLTQASVHCPRPNLGSTADPVMRGWALPPQPPNLLGDRVRELRIRRGMSQAELAGLDVSDAYISLIESGKRNPSQRVLEGLAQRLGCSVLYLLHGVSEEAVAGLAEQARQATDALIAGRAGEAVSRFAAVTSSLAFPAAQQLHSPVRRGLAQSLELSGRLAEAIEQWQLAAQAACGVDRDEWADIQVRLCRCLCLNADPDAAVEVAEHALRQLRPIGAHEEPGADAPGGADVWLLVGMALQEALEWRGDRLAARRFAERLVRVAEEGASPQMRLAAYAHAAALAGREGDHALAAGLAERALTAYDDGPPPADVSATVVEARLLLARDRPGDAGRARMLLRRRERQLAGNRNTDEASVCLIELARAELALDHPRQAATYARRAIDLLGDVHDEAKANALAVIGLAHIRLDELRDALEVWTRCAKCLERIGHRRRAAQLWCEVAETLRRSGAGNRRQTMAYRRALALIDITEDPRAQPTDALPGPAASQRDARAGHRGTS